MSSYHVYNGELVGVGSEERPAPDQCSLFTRPAPPTLDTASGDKGIIPQIGIPPPSPAQAGILICHK